MYKLLLVVTVLGLVLFYVTSNKSKDTSFLLPESTGTNNLTEGLSIIAKDLDTPWAIDFLPSGNLLVTERPGRVNEINTKTGTKEAVLDLPQVKEIGEGGLLGLVLDPDFPKNNFVYLYYTYSGEGDKTLNRVVRMIYKDKKLSDENIVVDEIPGASNHNGGRIKFGPDGNLYITTGDAQDSSKAQDLGSLSGKILRVISGGTEIYSYGHRNPQGLVWDSGGQLWSTEHGPSGTETGNDELNKIDQGKNYGWPEIRGGQTKENMITPIIESGKGNTWAPAGLAYLDGSLFFGGLRGSALYEYKIGENKVIDHYKNEFGRIRDVVLGPDNMLYLTTSNRDGRGIPKEGDDKIIRIRI